MKNSVNVVNVLGVGTMSHHTGTNVSLPQALQQGESRALKPSASLRLRAGTRKKKKEKRLIVDIRTFHIISLEITQYVLLLF